MLGLVPPHDHGEERRLLLPPTRHGHPEHDPGDPTLGVADLGVIGQVAGKADGGLGHGVPPPVAWPGSLPCPWTRGRWTPRHAARPAGASGGANEVGPTESTAGRWSAQEPSWLVGRLRLGVGYANYRPARSLHPGRGGRTRLRPRELLAARPRPPD